VKTISSVWRVYNNQSIDFVLDHHRQQLVCARWYSMVGQRGVRDLSYFPFLHVTSGAIVKRVLRNASLYREAAALQAVADEALGAVVACRCRLAWLYMRIMACQTAEFTSAFPEATAGLHGREVVQQIGLLLPACV